MLLLVTKGLGGEIDEVKLPLFSKVPGFLWSFNLIKFFKKCALGFFGLQLLIFQAKTFLSSTMSLFSQILAISIMIR